MNFITCSTVDGKRTSHDADVANGFHKFACGQPIEEGVNFDMWPYRVHNENHYVLNLCLLTDEDLEA